MTHWVAYIRRCFKDGLRVPDYYRFMKTMKKFAKAIKDDRYLDIGKYFAEIGIPFCMGPHMTDL